MTNSIPQQTSAALEYTEEEIDRRPAPVDSIFEFDESALAGEEPEEQDLPGIVPIPAIPYVVGETVWVPARFTGDPATLYPWVERKISAVDGSKVFVEGGDPRKISHKRIRRSLRVVLIAFGDFVSEAPTIDPLNKSLIQYLTLLLPPQAVVLYKVRTRAEVRKLWETESGPASMVVLSGHASETGFVLGAEDLELGADSLIEDLGLGSATQSKLTIVCLACRTGTAEFAKQLSKARAVDHVLAPFSAVHAGVASLFAQALFACHFLQGLTIPVAFNQVLAYSDIARARFRLWTRGSLVGSATGSQPTSAARAT